MNHTTYILKSASRALRDHTLGWLWAWRLAYRVVSGRWYVFHDAPWWVVRTCVAPGADDLSDEDMQIVRWARQESALRLRKGRFEP